MKPYIICHMMASVDGRIDCSMTEKMGSEAYYPALECLNCHTLVEGKITNIMHNCPEGTFKAQNDEPIGHMAWHKAVAADGYHCSVDTHGTLLWDQNTINGLPQLCIISESAPKAYAHYLNEKGISWIAAGVHQVDLMQAMEILNAEFGVERVAVVGGGHINGAFLKAGLLDEVSVVIGAAIDGRKGWTSVFDGIEKDDDDPYHLKLVSVEICIQDAVWLRYKIS